MLREIFFFTQEQYDSLNTLYHFNRNTNSSAYCTQNIERTFLLEQKKKMVHNCLQCSVGKTKGSRVYDQKQQPTWEQRQKDVLPMPQAFWRKDYRC